MDLLALDPTGERARLLLAVRAAPVALGAFGLSILAFVALGPGTMAAFAALGDAVSILLALSLAAMLMGTSELTYPAAPRATTAVATAGVVAALAAAALSAASLGGGGGTLLPAVILAYAAIGACLVAWNALALATRALGRGVAAMGMLGGTAFVLGALSGEPPDPLAMLAGVLAIAGFPAWAWGARRAMLAAVADPARGPASTGVNA